VGAYIDRDGSTLAPRVRQVWSTYTQCSNQTRVGRIQNSRRDIQAVQAFGMGAIWSFDWAWDGRKRLLDPQSRRRREQAIKTRTDTMDQLICMIRPEPTPGAEVLGHVLNGLNHVGYFGETAHLKNINGGCVECAAKVTRGAEITSCPVYTTNLYERLNAANNCNEWYGAFGDTSSAKTVIALEASRHVYGDLGLGNDIKVLVLYQNPMEWMVGALAHYGLQYLVTPGDLLDICGKWGSFYADHLRWLEAENIAWASFDLDAFGGNPELGLKKLCWYYQLEFHKDALRWHDGDHHKSSGKWAVNGDPPPQDIRKTTRYLEVFSKPAIKSVIGDSLVSESYRALAKKKINTGQ
jgi:hypothetical protein